MLSVPSKEMIIGNAQKRDILIDALPVARVFEQLGFVKAGQHLELALMATKRKLRGQGVMQRVIAQEGKSDVEGDVARRRGAVESLTVANWGGFYPSWREVISF